MLKEFRVKNFKNFKDEIVLDFTKNREYGFNNHLIKNGLINKLLIYGKNSSGKTNLGLAIMDIVLHLSNNSINNMLYTYVINGDAIEENVEFYYNFLFNDKDVIYKYSKDQNGNLMQESLYENTKLLFEYNYKNNKFTNNITEAKDFNLGLRNKNISVLKAIYTNTLFWDDHSTINQLMTFVDGMLLFRSVEGNQFIGGMSNSEDLNDFIINNKKIKDFESFLSEAGQEYKLCEMTGGFGKQVVGVQYKNNCAQFELVASSGAKALWLFYYWMNRLDDVSFVYLDEFDAFYHYELSRYILNYINSKTNFQSILTTHNTNLASNRTMRPDCFAIIKDNKITSFADSTSKIIREAHNIEKMYLGGEFE